MPMNQFICFVYIDISGEDSSDSLVSFFSLVYANHRCTDTSPFSWLVSFFLPVEVRVTELLVIKSTGMALWVLVSLLIGKF